MEKFYKIIDFDEFCYTKDDEKIKYFRLVLRVNGGYSVEKLSRDCYEMLCNSEDYYKGLCVKRLLYNSFHQVVDIIE